MLNLVWVVTSMAIVVFIYYGVPYLYTKVMRIFLKRKVKKYNAMALTFDDGPGDRVTRAILKILDENNAKATFFLLGRNITGRENIVRQIADAGHDIRSHSYQHLHSWKVVPLRAVRDIRRGWRVIDQALGTNQCVYPFRPPCGGLNLIFLLYVLARGVPIIFWTLDVGDRETRKKDPTTLKSYDTQHPAELLSKTGGAVVFAHDSNRQNPDMEAFTLASINSLLTIARQNGMQVITVSQLLNHKKRALSKTFPRLP